MKNLCTKVMQEIASGGIRSSESDKHLAECPDCALFLRMNSLETEYPDVPEHLDSAILAEAHRYTAHRRWKIWKIALPIAASFAVASGLVFYSLQPMPEQKSAASAQMQSIYDYDESLISLSCEVANGVSLFDNAYEISNQGVQII